MLAIRWTIGDVSPAGFETLRLSITGAARLFPRQTPFVVCVNTIGVEEAARRCGLVPVDVTWLDVTSRLPPWLVAHLDEGRAQGAAWKLAPVRVFPDLHELALDNDVVLWERPAALDSWLEAPDAVLVAEDVRACYGRFTHLCGPEPRNLGIRGLPPRFELAATMRALLDGLTGPLTSELDEQGLQLAALAGAPKRLVVPLTDVTICSPFPPHLPHLGRCGAHFCGLNARRLGWTFDGHDASQIVGRHFENLREAVAARVAPATQAA